MIHPCTRVSFLHHSSLLDFVFIYINQFQIFDLPLWVGIRGTGMRNRSTIIGRVVIGVCDRIPSHLRERILFVILRSLSGKSVTVKPPTVPFRSKDGLVGRYF